MPSTDLGCAKVLDIAAIVRCQGVPSWPNILAHAKSGFFHLGTFVVCFSTNQQLMTLVVYRESFL